MRKESLWCTGEAEISLDDHQSLSESCYVIFCIGQILVNIVGHRYTVVI